MSINLTDELQAKTKKGKLGAAKQIFLDGDTENLQQIGEKTHQLEDSIKKIAATGGASQATAVTYDNANSQLTAVNIQSAVDELQGSKIDKTSIVQVSGEAENKVMSQLATRNSILHRWKKHPILDADICSKGGKYSVIEDVILDLEIISDSPRNFAPVSFYFSGKNDIHINFYEVDEKGAFINASKPLTIDFKTTERKLLFILDKEISFDGWNAKISIAVDSSALTSDFDVYSPSFISSYCKSEHWGLISILRTTENNATTINHLCTYGNSLFQNLTETDQFLTNGSLSNNATYVGYMSGIIPVKKGDKYRCYGDFNYTKWKGNLHNICTCLPFLQG